MSFPHWPPLLRSIQKLKVEIGNLDTEFDGCQEIYTRGEAEGFLTEKFLVHRKNPAVLSFSQGIRTPSHLKNLYFVFDCGPDIQSCEMHIYTKVLQWGRSKDENGHTDVRDQVSLEHPGT